MSVFIGCSGQPLKRESYFKTFNALEVLPSQELPPRPSTAQKWLEEAPEGFAFTMVASRFFSVSPEQLPPGLEGSVENYGGFQLTDELLDLYAKSHEAAIACKAKLLVFITPPQISPSRRGKEALSRFFRRVDRTGVRIAWEPHGPWENKEVEELCHELDVVRCVDPLREAPPPGRTAYARLGPFAVMGRAMADDELESIAEVLEPFEEAYCFFNTERAFQDAQRFRATCQS